MTAGAEDLERRCRDLLHAPAAEDDHGAPITFVDREMALTLDHIERLRRQDRRVRRRLLDRECDIEGRIMNLYPLPYQNLGSEWIDRAKLINQLTNVLAKIDEHYRRNAAKYDKRMHLLHDRLLQLLNMREQLDQHDGHSPDTP